MLNRYQGNTGRVQRIDDNDAQRKVHSPPDRASVHGEQGLFESIRKLLSTRGEGLDSEDIILLLILYLMYRESGDTELLIIMGAMFLL